MLRLLHLSDTHLDQNIEGLEAKKARKLSRAAFSKALEFAVTNQTELLIIAGDLFDRNADESAVEFAKSELAQLPTQLKVFVAGGNHDRPEFLAELNDLANLTVTNSGVLSQLSFETSNIKVRVLGTGVNYENSKAGLAVEFPKAEPGTLTIGVLHSSLDGRYPREVCQPVDPYQLSSLNYDYWALGHIHFAHQVLANPTLVYPGPLQANSSKDRGIRGGVFARFSQESSGRIQTSLELLGFSSELS